MPDFTASASNDEKATKERRDGRAAAERLAGDWPDTSWVPLGPSTAWANAAIERFAELIEEQPAIFRATQEGAGRGARTLSARPHQGLLESLQNADDLGATNVRFALADSEDGTMLYIAHDGAPVRLHHVGAMVLPWLTTKTGEVEASGRFGVGQQTLKALGGPLEVHSPPFHFRLEESGPEVCEPVMSGGGFPVGDEETLFALPLLPSVDPEEIASFLQDIGSESLLFLQSVRRLSLLEIGADRVAVDHRLDPVTTESVEVQFRGEIVSAERTELLDPETREGFIRYVMSRPLTTDEPKRKDKATGEATPLGVAIYPHEGSGGRLFDRLPFPIRTGLPISLNAQFDPDTPRTTLLKTEWNRRRLDDLGSFVAGVALAEFEGNQALAWRAVPLEKDLDLPVDSDIRPLLVDHVIQPATAQISTELRLGSEENALENVVYPEPNLQRLLTPADLEALAPGRSALPPELLDAHGRWRVVLDEFGASLQLEVEDALALFGWPDGRLGDRQPEWFVGMAAAAARADKIEALLWEPSILLADGRRVEPPGANDPQCLVLQSVDGSLAHALGIPLPLHPAYLADTDEAQTVVTALEDCGILRSDLASDDAALEVLARDYGENTIGRIRLTDEQVLSLRGALERLDRDKQIDVAPRIGLNVELRAYCYDASGEKLSRWVSPSEAYLPSVIDRESDSFARVARRTPDILWLEPDYQRLLTRKRAGRNKMGAQRFLSALGAENTPRLVRPPNETQKYASDKRLTSGVDWQTAPEVQQLEIKTLSTWWDRRLMGDRWCPDLDAVIRDIIADKAAKRRRKRGIGLLALLVRTWDRQFADHITASAVYGYYGWNDPREVIATWLARAVSEGWLPNGNGAMRSPVELCLPTEANRVAYGDDRSMFLAKVDDRILASAAVRALRFKRGPSASSLVTLLRELREQELTDDVRAEAMTAYRLLAMHCPSDRRRPVDDMSASDLKEAFRDGSGRKGLLLANDEWLSPDHVFGGEHIFGAHRPFAPRSRQLEPLWRLLDLQEPNGSECMAFLRSLPPEPLSPEDRGFVLQTFRALARMVSEMSPQLKVHLRRLPLWTGSGWCNDRPVYAFDGAAIDRETVENIPVWDSGFSNLDEIRDLLEPLRVVPVRLEDFSPDRLDGMRLVIGDHLRPQFALAVEHLRDELARGDQALHDSLLEVTTWRDLMTAHVLLDPQLTLSAKPDGASEITVDADAFMLRDPIALVVRSERHLGSASAGGKAIASLFAGDRQKIAWAWASMWLRADAGVAPEQILLSTDRDEGVPTSDLDRLVRLQGQATMRSRKRNKKPSEAGARTRASTLSVEVQRLKNLALYEPDEGRIVNAGVARPGVLLPKPDPAAEERRKRVTLERPPGKAVPNPSRKRTVPAPMTDREQLALDAVLRALRLDPPAIADLRERHGIGADAMDELRQFYEIKMESSEDLPDEVTLQGSQMQAAQENEDFFLAVVSGLSEDGGELRVRFIFDPLSKLTMKVKGSATLKGVREVEALEYRFPKKEYDGNE